MGIKGLSSLLKTNEQHLGERRQLRGTKLVIDARNLQYHLFQRLCLGTKGQFNPNFRCDKYRGNLVAYGALVREFFVALEKADIEAELVFDGVGRFSDHSDRTTAHQKSGTGQKAAPNWMASDFRPEISSRIGHQMTETSVKDILTPSIVEVVFKNVASEFQVGQSQVAYEADPTIARRANEKHCPVLSNDSDFILYDLEEGLLLLDLVDEDFLEGCLFKRDNFKKFFEQLDPQMMCLLKFVSNFKESTLEPFFKSLPSSLEGGLKLATDDQKRLAASLAFLSDRKATDELADVPDKFDRLIRKFNLHGKPAWTLNRELLRYLSEANSGVAKEEAQKVADFFTDLFKKRGLSASVLKLLIQSRLYLYGTIEAHDEAPVSQLCRRPLKSIRALLKMSTNECLPFHLIEWDSEGKRISKELTPKERLKTFRCLHRLNIYHLVEMQSEDYRHDRERLLLGIFRFKTKDFDEAYDLVRPIIGEGTPSFANETTVALLLVRYIALERRRKTDGNFVVALVLVIYFYRCQSLLSQKNGNRLSKMEHRFVELIKARFSKDSKQLKKKGHSEGYRQTVHYISEFQAVFETFCTANTLLGQIITQPRAETYLDGVLLFRITQALLTWEVTLWSLCAGSKDLLSVCQWARKFVHCQCLPITVGAVFRPIFPCLFEPK